MKKEKNSEFFYYVNVGPFNKSKDIENIYLSLSKPHGNLKMFFDFALQRSSAEERLKTLDPPELQKDHF